MVIDVVTIFPKMIECVISESMIKKARERGAVRINIINLRDFSKDKHKKVDDRPFGGGPGMVMKPEPFFEAVDYIRSKRKASSSKMKSRIILLSPKGRVFNQRLALELSKYKHIVILNGHYEGVDERVARFLADEEISIGDFILTGGEVASLVIIDSLIRLVPGALGHNASLRDESFSNGLLEYPHYTRPRIYRGMEVPRVLLSGDHKKIEAWRREQAIRITKERRKDLIENL